ARVSTYTLARCTRSLGSSRVLGVKAPTALTCAPGSTDALTTTGVGLVVQAATMSAAEASSGVAGAAGRPAVTLTHSANAAALSVEVPETSTWRSERTRRIVSTWKRAWTPVPK